MFWEEKIDLMKKEFSVNEFSIPSVGRKQILRAIESKFIKRPPGYVSTASVPFLKWYEHFTSPNIKRAPYHYGTLLDNIIQPNTSYWIACEFGAEILIYKAQKEAIKLLMTIGQTWTHTFHIIELKYQFMCSCQITSQTSTDFKHSGPSSILTTIKNL